jgi:hypothetical protein
MNFAQLFGNLYGIGRINSSCSKLFSTQNYRVLREIDRFEMFNFNHRDISKAVRKYRIKSKIDYNKEQALIKNAIVEIKKMYPFLNANKIDDKSTNKSYFVINTQNQETFLNNIEFLTILDSNYSNQYISTNENKYDAVSKLLIDRELVENVDYSNKPFWKMIFLKIGPITDSNYYLYDVIITVHHSISEERSNYTVFMKLLDTIDMIYKKSYDSKKLVEYKLIPSVGQIVQKIPSLVDSNKYLPLFKKPPIFDLKLVDKHEKFDQLNHINSGDLNTIEIRCEKNKKSFLSIQELVKISQTNKSKFIFTEIESKNFNLLIKMCKFYDVKMTSCLSLISTQALNMIYIQHNIMRPISYNTIISPRALKQFKNEYDYNNMGYFLTENYDIAWFERVDHLDNVNFNENFWMMCKEKTNQLDLAIKNLKFKIVTDGDDFNPHNSNFYIDLIISNISKYPRTKSKHECQEILKTDVACVCESNYFFTFNAFHTMNKQNGFNIFFNSDFVSEEIVKNYVLNFNFILERIVN